MGFFAKRKAPASEGGRYTGKSNPRRRRNPSQYSGQEAAPTTARETQEGGKPGPYRRKSERTGRPFLCQVFVRAGTEGRRYAALKDRAGFGYVGIEIVDCIGELLFDYAAF